ncbi:MAG: alkyl hydroperoxide reductase subunit F [Acidiferrobacterales bacterium]|nr:alkyl hydroperoxide reductase subunit F [Acidiferrobacterales bacterium]
MLTPEILNALKSYTANMQNAVTFVLQTGEHSKRAELVDFLEQVASVSDKLILEQRDAGYRSPITFALETPNGETGIVFSGIPSGHEFNSLILAVLWSSGTAMKLDDNLQSKLATPVADKLHFEVFISLDCHNCPDVLQALNQFALLNMNITTEMIDGGLFRNMIEERDIQGVPSVYLNGEKFANGKTELSTMVDRLAELYPVFNQAVAGPQLPLQDVTVVGGGPAGVAAAIYSARKGLAVTLVADVIGGQVKDTMGIENLISVSKTTGPELVGNMQEHMADYDITIKEHVRVDSIEKGNIKTLNLSSGEVINTKTIIIATGARWRELGVPGEKENIGNGVAYCPHCDGPFFKGKDVAVIGGGNSGIEAALDLAGIVKSVTVFEFMPTLKADQVLVDQAEKRDNIRILKNVATNEIHATNGKVSSIEYTDRASEEVTNLELAGIFVQIGLLPNSQFAKGVVDVSQHGEIIIDERCKTSEEGIFACGDVTTVPYKQIVISMGEGSKASLSAFEYLLTHEVTEEEAAKLAA